MDNIILLKEYHGTRVQYIVDGYNVIHASDAFGLGSLRDRRERFLRFIESRGPGASGAHHVTVVFDGREDASSPKWPGPTSVVFSRGRDADGVIKDRVDGLGNPREAMVVTDDRAIQRWVRAAGARVMSCAEFLAAGDPSGHRPLRVSSLSSAETDSINEELRKLWKLK
jgi:predicted RNA-binding protein with PIN domain